MPLGRIGFAGIKMMGGKRVEILLSMLSFAWLWIWKVDIFRAGCIICSGSVSRLVSYLTLDSSDYCHFKVVYNSMATQTILRYQI